MATLDQIRLPGQYTQEELLAAQYPGIFQNPDNGYFFTGDGEDRRRINLEDFDLTAAQQQAYFSALNDAGYVPLAGLNGIEKDPSIFTKSQTAQQRGIQNLNDYLAYQYGPGEIVTGPMGDQLYRGTTTTQQNPFDFGLSEDHWTGKLTLGLIMAAMAAGAGAAATGTELGASGVAPAATEGTGSGLGIVDTANAAEFGTGSYGSTVLPGGTVLPASGAAAAGGAGAGLTTAQQWAQSLGGLNADGSINWAAIDASPTLQSMGAISGDFGAIPFGTSASGSGTILDQLRTLANGGNLPSGSSLSSLFSGGSSNGSDLLRTLGTLGATGLGVYGANQQQNAYSDLADKYLAMGAPFREKLLSSYSPDFSVSSIPGAQDAIDTTMNSTLRGLSTSGNPFDNPGALMEANKYVTSNVALPAIQNYRSQLGTFGQLGTNTAGAADTAAAGASGGAANALGYGLNQVTNPQTSLADMLKKYSINFGSTF